MISECRWGPDERGHTTDVIYTMRLIQALTRNRKAGAKRGRDPMNQSTSRFSDRRSVVIVSNLVKIAFFAGGVYYSVLRASPTELLVLVPIIVLSAFTAIYTQLKGEIPLVGLFRRLRGQEDERRK